MLILPLFPPPGCQRLFLTLPAVWCDICRAKYEFYLLLFKGTPVFWFMLARCGSISHFLHFAKAHIENQCCSALSYNYTWAWEFNCFENFFIHYWKVVLQLYPLFFLKYTAGKMTAVKVKLCNNFIAIGFLCLNLHQKLECSDQIQDYLISTVFLFSPESQNFSSYAEKITVAKASVQPFIYFIHSSAISVSWKVNFSKHQRKWKLPVYDPRSADIEAHRHWGKLNGAIFNGVKWLCLRKSWEQRKSPQI